MRFSIASTLLILAVGGTLGLMRQQRLAALRSDQQALVEQAEKLGITSLPADVPGATAASRRQRDDGSDEARAMTAELIAFAREMEARRKAGQPEDEEGDDRSTDLMNRLMRLDARQLKLVIGGLRDDRSLPEESRRNMIGFSIMMLGDDHPASALALFSESSDLLGTGILARQVVASSLMSWAKDDPMAALTWIRANESLHPDIANEDAKRSILAGAAKSDPVLAFRLIGEMKLADSSAAIDAVVESAGSPGQRTSVLAALRGHLATLASSEERDEVLGGSLESMGRNLSGEDFETVRSWIADAKLSQQESASFSAGLSYFNTKEDTGRWIDWMAENLSGDAARECADNLIGQWTQQDYLAAGKWLAAAPDGPVKSAAVATYAETVAEYEPRVAEQWALTLPDGDERKATLVAIHQNWPARDAAAAAEFASRYGIDAEEPAEEPTEEP